MGDGGAEFTVADHEQADEEPSDGTAAKPLPSSKGRKSFLRMRRELTDEELGTSAVQKLLMDELERLESEAASLRVFEEKFHDRDKRASILEEKIKKNLSSDIYFGASLTVGSALMSWSSSVWEIQPTGYVILLVGTALMIAGICARVILK